MKQNTSNTINSKSNGDSIQQGSVLQISQITELFRSFDSNYAHNLSLALAYLLHRISGQFAVYHRFDSEQRQIIIHHGIYCPDKFRMHGRSNGRVCHDPFGPGKQDEAIYFNDLRSSDYWQSDPDLRRYGLKAFIGGPVCMRGQVIGSLAVYDKDPRDFSDANLADIEMIAEIVSFLDARHKAETDLNKKLRHEQMLTGISASAISGLSIDRCLTQCMEIIGRSMDADAVMLFYEDPKILDLTSLANWWRDPDARTATQRDLSSLISLPLVSQVLSTNESYHCDEITDAPDPNTQKILKRYKIKSLLLLPLSHQHFVHGVCCVCMTKTACRWLPVEVGVLETVSQILAQRLISRSIAHRLDESEALVYQMFQLSPVAIYRIDLLRQRFIAVNDHMCHATGYSREEFLSLNPINLLTAESRKLYRSRLKAMAEGKSVSSNVDYEVITKSGVVEWARFHIRHLFDGGRTIGANVVAHFITEQKKVREELAIYRKELESLVQARTAELAKTNQQLRAEIEQRKKTAMELRVSSDRLKELNTAMRVLLDKRIEDHHRTEELIRLNLKELIDPFLNRLENSGLRNAQKQLIEIIRMNLEEVVGSSMPEFSSKYYMFSPNELQVANLIRQGRTSKEVARLLNLSARTVDSYRASIRRKLGLKKKKVNLRTYLASI
jgi:PAS domain S-box-containing protein